MLRIGRISLLLLSCWIAFPAAAASYFQSASVYPVGTQPVNVASADLNKDGKADVLTTVDRGIEVFLNSGNGTLLPPTTVSTPGTPFSILIADLNGDGNLDVFAVGTGPTSQTILLGNGDGTFHAPMVIGDCDYSPIAGAIGDFNGDGIPDVAVSNEGQYPAPGSWVIYTGKGDGTFSTGACTSPYTGYIVAADVNRDGKLDLLVPGSRNYGLKVMLGNGDGTFQKPLSYDKGGSLDVIAAVDVNRDGILDVIGTNTIYGNKLEVLLGNGDGSFQSPLSFNTVSTNYAMAVGDYNGDGNIDVSILGDGAQLLLGNGDGTFSAGPTYALSGTGNNGATLATDIDGDNHLDLVSVVAFASDLVIMRGNGDGTFQGPRTFVAGSMASYYTTMLGTGDFNGDGKQDVAVSFPKEVDVLLGNGDGSFRSPKKTTIGTYNLGGVTRDFNKDGKLDLAVADQTGSIVNVLLGKGNGSFQAAVSYPISYGISQVLSADINGDDKLDLVVGTAGAVSGTIAVFLGNGDGTFQPAVNTTLTPLGNMTLGDFNRDGKLDLAASVGSTGTDILLGNGDGTFQTPYAVPGAAAGFLQALDFNRDGKIDLAVEAGTLSIFLGNGDGTFQPAITGPSGLAGTPWFSDINRDGKLDFLALDAQANLAVALGNGDGTFQPLTIYYSNFSACCQYAAVDLNGDKYLDLVLAGIQSVEVLLNTKGN